MHRCPRCDLMLTSAEIGTHALEGCDECGGVWVSGLVLADLVKREPALLATADQRFNPSGAKSLRVGRVPVCAECGGELAEHRFPVAPQLPLLSCAKCRCLWLEDGQCHQLMLAINPDLDAPSRVVDAAVEELEAAEAGDDVESDREATLDLLLSLWWPPRLKGQPSLPWLVCGMPLWCAAVLAIAFPTVVTAFQGGELSLGGVLGAMWVFTEFWFAHSLFLLVVLTVVWALRDGMPDCTVLQRYLLLLRFSPMVNLLTLVVGGLAWLCYPPLAELAIFAAQVWLIWKAAELQPLDMSDARALMTRAPWYF